MNIKEIKNIFKVNSNDLAFLVGNGVNLHFSAKNLSWKDLLLSLWNKFAESKRKSIPDGISFTEFYDTLDIVNFDKKYFSNILQKEVQKIMNEWQPVSEQKLVYEKIKSFRSPIITPNFDDLIPKLLKLNFYNLKNPLPTDFYPWSCYYGDKILNNPIDGFGVWYPDGMIKYHRSIKLGLSQYMGSVERARKMIHNNYENIVFTGKNKNNWLGYDTWLHIFFNKSLFIFGFGFDESEVFLRWLLIERAKYFKKFPDRKHEGWYITTKNSTSKNIVGKKFFMESVGINVIEVRDRKIIYEEIWK
jgi:hypothetical protein